jgi:putative PIN family toxin of toxin-antitoxin system
LTTRIVADTNVLVSGLGWAGPCAQILDAVTDGRLQLVSSPALLSELRRVLAYPKLAQAIDDPAGLAALIEALAVVVAPTRTINTITDDEDDNRVLEAAVTGTVQYVISGDRHLLDLGSFQQIPILRPAAFCAQILDDPA